MNELELVNKTYLAFAKYFAYGTISPIEKKETITIDIKIPKAAISLLKKMYPNDDLKFMLSELISFGIIKASNIEEDIGEKVSDSEGNNYNLKNMDIKGNG